MKLLAQTPQQLHPLGTLRPEVTAAWEFVAGDVVVPVTVTSLRY